MKFGREKRRSSIFSSSHGGQAYSRASADRGRIFLVASTHPPGALGHQVLVVASLRVPQPLHLLKVFH